MTKDGKAFKFHTGINGAVEDKEGLPFFFGFQHFSNTIYEEVEKVPPSLKMIF